MYMFGERKGIGGYIYIYHIYIRIYTYIGWARRKELVNVCSIHVYIHIYIHMGKKKGNDEYIYNTHTDIYNIFT